MDYSLIREFNFENYLSNYPELVTSGINTEEKALKHFKKFGIKEGRHSYKINDTTVFVGSRFGNRLFVNLVCEYIAKKENLKMTYIDNDKFNQLGIFLYSNNNYVIKDFNIIKITDSIVDSVFINNELIKDKNIIISKYNYFQTPTVANYIRDRINIDKENIIKSNEYSNRINKNNDVFIHVRLGDIINLNNYEHFEYYDKALSNISFDKGYISSDSINHDIVIKLINKYNLNIFNNSEVKTIQFGSTCKHIVLSKGTFSFTIGIFGDIISNSNIYYPEKIKNNINWHGNIFVFSEWKKINY
jgi:hypothetical protein